MGPMPGHLGTATTWCLTCLTTRIPLDCKPPRGLESTAPPRATIPPRRQSHGPAQQTPTLGAPARAPVAAPAGADDARAPGGIEFSRRYTNYGSTSRGGPREGDA